ncbi:MAG: hypothetical protein COS89_06640 [Deltaproteobacteria bacterium CG07_land_8_20_14_0_80_38_7]|nr:MAG: hypothetical protein COS89_06640 [Deltaproteobacteria bacterium CG07_land_8_20_14_0_80_38_7]
MLNFESTQKILLEKLHGKKTFAIGYHADADGMSSTSILINYLLKNGVLRENITIYPINNLHRNFELSHLKEIMSNQPDVVICVDCATSKLEQFYYIREKAKTFICIDHHMFPPEIINIPHLYINSRMFPELTEPQNFTTSKLMNSFLFDPSNAWLELIGLEGDVATQSMQGSSLLEAANQINILGLVKEKEESIDEFTNRCNLLVNLLLESNNAPNFIEKLKSNKFLKKTHDTIINDIHYNAQKILEMKPTFEINHNKIFIYKIHSPNKFNIAEAILKNHFRHVGYNETYLIYSADDTLTVRLYTSNTKIDCSKIAGLLYGGGHTNRAGITDMKPDDLTIDMTLDMLIEKLKDAIKDAK